jgi:hypothetical protein
VVERYRWLLFGAMIVVGSSAYLVRSKGNGAIRQPSADFWFQGLTVQAISLDLSQEAMAELARRPHGWTRGAFRLGDNPSAHASVRFKGHRSLRGWADKPAFSIDFGRNDNQKHYGGLRSISLNNMVDDPSMLREYMGSRLYAVLGVPAPRVSFAELRVNGRLFGLYTIVEHLSGTTGPSFEGEYGCDLYPDNVWGFDQDGGNDDDRKLLAALAQRVHTEPISAWLLDDSASFDRDEVLSYLAASNLLADFDGYRHAHNYQLHYDRSSKLWSFVPWGFDRLLKKSFPVYESQGRVAKACFADPSCRLLYSARILSGAEKLAAANVADWIDRAQSTLAPYVKRDPGKPFSLKKQARAVADLRRFVLDSPPRIRKQVVCWDGSTEVDADGDGAGCTDCNDSVPAIHPGASEQCDGVDNDCSGVADDAVRCGCPSIQVGDANFRACAMPMSFWEAEQFCVDLGGTLAQLESYTQLAALQRALKPLRKREWWIGLTDQGHEGVYRWPDSSTASRNMWLQGEPDHYACGQHCATVASGKRAVAGLRDRHCAMMAPFVCSIR